MTAEWQSMEETPFKGARHVVAFGVSGGWSTSDDLPPGESNDVTPIVGVVFGSITPEQEELDALPALDKVPTQSYMMPLDTAASLIAHIIGSAMRLDEGFMNKVLGNLVQAGVTDFMQKLESLDVVVNPDSEAVSMDGADPFTEEGNQMGVD